MTKYQNISVKLSNSRLEKNATEVTLRLSPNMIGNIETNVSHKLLIN